MDDFAFKTDEGFAAMPLQLTGEQIALRIAQASVASFILGLNRDEHEAADGSLQRN